VPATTGGGRSSGRFRRRAWQWFVGVVVSIVVLVLAGVPVYVRPQVDQLRKADAIVVLGGPGYARYKLGLQLAEQGWAPTVLASEAGGTEDPWLTKFCRTPRRAVLVNCFSPEPATTRGEARELRTQAAEHHWRTVIVVTFRPHVSRARFIVQRCFPGDVVMVASPPEPSIGKWAYQYLYQTAGYVRALIQPGC
jgi:uncharacterized SAM-binding protein YcdF (DUF218 family)